MILLEHYKCTTKENNFTTVNILFFFYFFFQTAECTPDVEASVLYTGDVPCLTDAKSNIHL